MLAQSGLGNELNDTGVRFVMAELDRAFSLLYVAATSHIVEERRKCCREAESAYSTAQGFLPGLPLTSSQEATICLMQRQIDHRLDHLKIVGVRV